MRYLELVFLIFKEKKHSLIYQEHKNMNDKHELSNPPKAKESQ